VYGRRHGRGTDQRRGRRVVDLDLAGAADRALRHDRATGEVEGRAGVKLKVQEKRVIGAGTHGQRCLAAGDLEVAVAGHALYRRAAAQPDGRTRPGRVEDDVVVRAGQHVVTA